MHPPRDGFWKSLPSPVPVSITWSSSAEWPFHRPRHLCRHPVSCCSSVLQSRMRVQPPRHIEIEPSRSCHVSLAGLNRYEECRNQCSPFQAGCVRNADSAVPRALKDTTSYNTRRYVSLRRDTTKRSRVWKTTPVRSREHVASLTRASTDEICGRKVQYRPETRINCPAGCF